MSFFKLSTGETAQASESFEVEGGSNYVFADGSTVMTMIDDAKWQSFDGGERFINLRFSVVAPATDANGVKIANRKLFARLYPIDGDRKNKGDKAPQKRDRDLKMLLAIDANVYGKLAKIDGEPSDSDLQSSLMGKPFVSKWGAYEMGDRKGNWLMGVFNATKELSVSGGDSAPVQQKPESSGGLSQGTAFDDDIPFAPCF